jgi:hypothetical protein
MLNPGKIILHITNLSSKGCKEISVFYTFKWEKVMYIEIWWKNILQNGHLDNLEETWLVSNFRL